jgi:hypothetical protein
MKIAKTELQAIELSLKAIEQIKLPDARIDEGVYKGGLYDCYFILDPNSGEELFAIAY